MYTSKRLLKFVLAAQFAMTATTSAFAPAKENLQDGTIIMITPSQLALKDADGKEYSYDIVEKTQLSLDGKACRPQDLKSGLKARVATDSGESKTAITVDAIDKNPLFENMLEGKVVTADMENLVMIADDAKSHSFIVTKDTKVTCDGKECKAADLPANARVRVTKDKTDEFILLIIQAIVENPDFRPSES